MEVWYEVHIWQGVTFTTRIDGKKNKNACYK